MKKEKIGLGFWLGLFFVNIVILFFTVLWQGLSYYGPQHMSRAEEIESIIHSLKMLGIALPIGLTLIVCLNYLAIKSRQEKCWRQVFWISIIYVVLNLFVAIFFALQMLGSSAKV